MTRTTRLVLLAVVALALVAVVARPRWPSAPAVAAPQVFSGPVNGGCYLATPTTCAIHVDDWQPITPDSGQRLVGFQLAAQSGGAGPVILYDFRTDVSNPPATPYNPSLVKKDFAARCGVTYELSLAARDSGDAGFEEVGRTNQFQCPAALMWPQTYLPTVLNRTLE